VAAVGDVVGVGAIGDADGGAEAGVAVVISVGVGVAAAAIVAATAAVATAAAAATTQELILVHFSAQLEPCLSQENTLYTLETP